MLKMEGFYIIALSPKQYLQSRGFGNVCLESSFCKFAVLVNLICQFYLVKYCGYIYDGISD